MCVSIFACFTFFPFFSTWTFKVFFSLILCEPEINKKNGLCFGTYLLLGVSQLTVQNIDILVVVSGGDSVVHCRHCWLIESSLVGIIGSQLTNGSSHHGGYCVERSLRFGWSTDLRVFVGFCFCLAAERKKFVLRMRVGAMNSKRRNTISFFE